MQRYGIRTQHREIKLSKMLVSFRLVSKALPENSLLPFLNQTHILSWDQYLIQQPLPCRTIEGTGQLERLFTANVALIYKASTALVVRS